MWRWRLRPLCVGLCCGLPEEMSSAVAPFVCFRVEFVCFVLPSFLIFFLILRSAPTLKKHTMHAETMKMVRLNTPKPVNRPPTTIMTDWFQNLVQWAWWKTGLVFVLVLATLTFGFAGIYDALGPFPCPTDANASAVSSFPDMLLYSTSITSTLLQARCIPLSSDEAMVVANFHGWAMLLITVFLTGVVFTRMAKPGMSVTMSNKMLFRFNDNIHGPTLVCRIFFDKAEYSLIDAKFNIMFTRKIRKNFLKTDLLELVRPEAPLLVVGTNISVRFPPPPSRPKFELRVFA